jgi:hypothetical protein
MQIDASQVHDLELREAPPGTYDINTTGKDPYVFTLPLTTDITADSEIFSFEYFCPTGLDFFEFRMITPNASLKPIMIRDIGSTEGWVEFTVDLTNTRNQWGAKGDQIRIDLGAAPALQIQLRNLRIRPFSQREKELNARKAAQQAEDQAMEEYLHQYLGSTYDCKVEQVTVNEQTIEIKGTLGKEGTYSIAEIAPYSNMDDLSSFPFTQKIRYSNEDHTFTLSLKRHVQRGNYTEDRLLSKWAIIRQADAGPLLASAARHPDQIAARHQYQYPRLSSIKGIGGFSANREAPISDLDELGVSSVTINIWVNQFYRSKAAPEHLEHTYQGKTFYIDKAVIERYDQSFLAAASRQLEVSAILLVDKASKSQDTTIGRLLQHPDCDPAGIYSMPNVTTPDGVSYYAAILDFLASRYMRPDNRYGRIHHWIIHNEVDAGWVWTNAGEKPPLVFLSLYHKSMRMVNNIAKSYHPDSKVFISLTHYWNWTSNPRFYLSKELLEYLLQYSKTEGDFDWAIAHHPYPESLREPKTWLDNKVSFHYETQLITFKNVEVLNAWVQLPEVLYKGKEKRLVYLSENGTNSPTYSTQDLNEQAAGMAYAMKKIKYLKGIDGFQYHNWQDNRKEGGLRIGLRKFPDDAEDPGGIKPVWHVYRAYGTDEENEVYDPYLPLIGIKNWEEARYKGAIYGKGVRMGKLRDLHSESWVATDGLGRTLPQQASSKSSNKKRYVGMFYFVTHNKTDISGPFNITELVQRNPLQPEWGDGSHYWAEPEIGYYLNQEAWAIRRHARQLADAGVDVIIIDVTNDRTYADVYGSICKVFQEMRQAGENTPDLAFLASEKSARQLWTEFYQPGNFQDLWFYWKGKPLLLYGQHEIPSRNLVNDIRFPKEMEDFFSMRQSWAWTSLPWYDNGQDEWPWVDHYPQAVGWHKRPEQAEMVPVAVAQHPLSNIGRSFHNFHQPDTDEYGLTPLTGKGMHFQEQWERALEVDPEFVFVTGWNEWSAHKMIMTENISQELQKWKFYPGAQLGKIGEPITPGEAYFIDQYNQEYSRDIEPMKGGHEDNYYYQLMANIRRYKGAEAPPASQQATIDLNGSFRQWHSISTTYYDHTGDTAHRKSQRQGQAGPYIDLRGRNDFELAKTAYDDENVYFYIRTVQPITAPTGQWMTLLINRDRQHSTGMAGYDLAVNVSKPAASKAILSQFDGQQWSEIGGLSYRYKQNEMMIALPLKFLKNGASLSFEFHWADNAVHLRDIDGLLQAGDNAPSRRANYLFTTTK